MPQRFLKPGITSSERWNACSWMAQSFYIRVITLVDDFGRYDADPRLLRSLCFPLSEDMKAAEVLRLMEELHKFDLADFYKSNAKAYLQLTNWSEKPRAEHSKYPNLENNCEQMFADVSKCYPSSSPSSSSYSPPPIDLGWIPNPVQKRLNALFRRKDSTRWSGKEEKAFKALGVIAEDDLQILERYYTAKIQAGDDYRRRDLSTLLNHFPGEVDRARNFKQPKQQTCF